MKVKIIKELNVEATIVEKKVLSENTITLLMSVSSATMVERFNEQWEHFYQDEVEGVGDFCEWIDREVGGCSRYNIRQLWDAYNNPEDETLKQFVAELKRTIAELKSR